MISVSFRPIALSNIVGLSEDIIWLAILADDSVEDIVSNIKCYSNNDN